MWSPDGWECNGVDCVCIIVIQDEDVLIATCGDSRKFLSLIGVGLEQVSSWDNG